jgi:2-aminoadipate transaminase
MLPKGITFADRFEGISGSAIREIFKVLVRPGIISFAGGNPSNDALPDGQCAQIARDVLLKDGKRILQYGATEGYPPFLESLENYLREDFDFPAEQKNILPLTGSSQGVDLLCKALLNPGDTVLTEDPTFLGNIQTMRLYQLNLVPVESDEDGLKMDTLETAVKKYRPKALYCIPTFQNPTGRTLAGDRRKRIAAMADQYGFLVIEDDPYRDLRYDGQPQPSVKHFDTSDHVVYLGSFSKLISPGLRVGFMAGHEEIVRKCTIGKQGSDLHTPMLNQAIIDQFIRRQLLYPHLHSILGPYRDKMHAMLDELATFPEGTRHTTPQGGLFIFCELPEGYNATERFPEAVENGVAYVPGTHFYPGGGHHNTLRLNFSNSTLEQIHAGMGILRKLFQTK